MLECGPIYPDEFQLEASLYTISHCITGLLDVLTSLLLFVMRLINVDFCVTLV